jgi:hypothetical protein
LVLLAGEVTFAAGSPEVALAERMAGEYRHVGGEADRAGIDRAIDVVADQASFIARGIMRRRLHESNGIGERIRIEQHGDEVTIAYNGPPRTARIGGPPVHFTARTGDELAYTLRSDGRRLVQRFEGKRGGRINSFHLDGDQLVVRVTIFSDRLPADVVYELRYARTP